MMDWIRLPEAVPSFGAMVGWAPQPLPVLPLIGVLLAAWYGWGVYRVTSSGRMWPWTRTASFLFGCILLILVTGLAVEGYGYELVYREHRVLSESPPAALAAVLVITSVISPALRQNAARVAELCRAPIVYLRAATVEALRRAGIGLGRSFAAGGLVAAGGGFGSFRPKGGKRIVHGVQACWVATARSAAAITGARSSCWARTKTFIASMAATEAKIALSSVERWERGLPNMTGVLRWCCLPLSKPRANCRFARKNAVFSGVGRTR
mgnify:CR=1 FL=1